MSKAISQGEIATPRNLTNLTWLLALIKFVLPFLIQSSAYGPHRDEFLYLAEARHMAWGYYEVPPLLSVFGWLINLMGGSLFWIKFWPSLFGAFTYILVGRLILSFGGRWFALVLGFMPFVLGYFVHVHFMLQPNFLEMFFWTLMAYGLVQYVHSGKNRNLYIAGIALGFGLLSKYSVAFFAFGLLAGLLLTKERKIFLNKHFYFAILIGIGIFMPNLIWEWQHGFPFLEQMKELKEQQLQNVSQSTFLTDQLLFNLPCIFTWVSGLLWVSFSAAGKPYRFIGWAVLIAIAIIVAGHGKGYYGMSAYPLLFGFGAVCLEQWTAGKLFYFRYSMVIFGLIVGLYLDTITLPFLPPKQLAAYYSANPVFRKMGFLRWEDQKDHPLPQDFADMLSWKEMTAKVAKVYNSLDSSEKSNTIIDCDNYGEAGAVDYFGPQFHLTPVMGHSASYLFWTPLDFYKKDVFIITTDYRAEIHESFIKEFKYAALADSITNPYAREYGSYIILLKYPSQKFRKVWKDEYESLKKDQSLFH
jgi:hypothetical protein